MSGDEMSVHRAVGMYFLHKSTNKDIGESILLRRKYCSLTLSYLYSVIKVGRLFLRLLVLQSKYNILHFNLRAETFFEIYIFEV